MNKRKKYTEFSKERQGIFLAHLVETANVSSASIQAGMSRKGVYKFKDARDEDGNLLHEQFAKAWDEAVEIGTDNLIEEARRRAMKGTEKPVGWYQGTAGGTVREYSDILLMFLIKARRPEYRDKTADLAIHGDLTIVKQEPGYIGSTKVKKEKLGGKRSTKVQTKKNKSS